MELRQTLCICLLLTIALPLGTSAPGDFVTSFVIPQSMPAAADGDFFDLAEEGTHKKTLDVSRAARGERWVFSAQGEEIAAVDGGVEINLPDQTLDAAADQGIPPTEIEINVYGDSDWYYDGENRVLLDYQMYTCEVNEPCPVGLWTHYYESCEGYWSCWIPSSPATFFDIGQETYYPDYIEVIATQGTNIRVEVYETGDPLPREENYPTRESEKAILELVYGPEDPDPQPEPRTQEGTVTHPVDELTSTHYYYDCVWGFSIQPGTGFRLEGLSGVDFDIMFEEDHYYRDYGGRWYDRFDEFIGAGDDWGNVPEKAESACILMEGEEDPGMYDVRYTDGLAPFAPGDHSDTQWDYAPECDIVFCSLSSD